MRGREGEGESKGGRDREKHICIQVNHKRLVRRRQTLETMLAGLALYLRGSLLAAGQSTE